MSRIKKTETHLIRDRIRELRRVRAGDLQADPRNWRKHPQAQRDALEGVLREVGYADALLAREEDGVLVLIDGHLRKDLDPEQVVPVLVLDVDEHEAKKILLTLDPLAAMAEANAEALDALLREVETGSEAVGKMLEELAAGAGIVPAEAEPVDAEPQVDRAKELQAQWGTATGQLWEIPSKTVPGKCHRVLCGDSTKAEDVGRLMGGERAGLMNTDPPYGVAYANDERPNPGVAKPRVAKPRVANDTLADEKLQEFLEAAFRAAVANALLPTAAWYMWHAHLTQGYFAAAAAAAAANVVLHRQIIWVKPVLLLGRGQYHWKHEPCFMGWVKGSQPPDYGEGNGERTQTTVWEIASVSQADRKEYGHSTPKPVGLFTIPIVKHLKRGEACYEPFAGSGPQLVAAENHGRLSYNMELDPGFVAVILQRATDCGLTPRLFPASAPAAAGGEK